MCLNCDKYLNDFQINGMAGKGQYREYALLGKGKGFLIKSDIAHSYIDRCVEDLFQQKKLVLVLDLDNTLIHTRDDGLDKNIKNPSFKFKDSNYDIYSAEMKPYKYLVKCRPFLAEFMRGLMPKYQIFFYTAGLR